MKMMSRAVAGPSCYGVLLMGLAAALLWPASSRALEFAPTPGEARQYFIGMHGAEDAASLKTSIESIMRYRVDERNDHATTLNVEPRFLRIVSGISTVLFDSTQVQERQRKEVSPMAAGFELDVADDGGAALSPGNSEALEVLTSQQDVLTPALFGEVLGLPGLVISLPPVVSETTTVAEEGLLSDVTLTVTDVTDEWIIATIGGFDQNEAESLPQQGEGNERPKAFDQLHGQLRVSINSGRIESLVLFAEQGASHDRPSMPRHLSLFVQALPDDAATGENAFAIESFQFVGLPTMQEDAPSYRGTEYVFPHAEANAPIGDARSTPDVNALFADRDEAVFRIDESSNKLILTVPLRIAEDEVEGYASLSALTLNDVDGEKIALPLFVTDIFQEIRNTDSQSIRIVLQPLGWEAVDWGAIRSVSATLAYRMNTVEEHLSIKLDDEPHEVVRGEALASIVPLEGEAGEWRLELTNGQDQLRLDRSAIDENTSAFLTNRFPNRTLPLGARGLLAKVSDPLAWVMQLRLEGRIEDFPLVYVHYADEPEQIDVTFAPGLSARRLWE
ncbi:hypothetical protein ACGLWX_11375 [Halomonas sp. HMF6819]|uniref:hypothetical protein n=1 Tax=Halomonas sp. HMF6819 TaxID=3373085 RepID=UPI00379B9C1B